jgi:hypothetical protein
VKLKIVIGLVVVVVLGVLAVTLLGGDDDSDKAKSAQNAKAKPAAKAKDAAADAGTTSDDKADSSSGSAPALRTVGIERAEGKDAAVNAGALMSKPGEIWLRISAAPKQKVTVNWTLACGTGATAQGNYDVTPPDTRQLELPKKNPKTCVASASTQINGPGRVKLAVMRDR